MEHANVFDMMTIHYINSIVLNIFVANLVLFSSLVSLSYTNDRLAMTVKIKLGTERAAASIIMQLM